MIPKFHEESFIVLHEDSSIIMKNIESLQIENLHIKTNETIYKFLKNYSAFF